jgi:hypothetical protein
MLIRFSTTVMVSNLQTLSKECPEQKLSKLYGPCPKGSHRVYPDYRIDGNLRGEGIFNVSKTFTAKGDESHRPRFYDARISIICRGA